VNKPLSFLNCDILIIAKVWHGFVQQQKLTFASIIYSTCVCSKLKKNTFSSLNGHQLESFLLLCVLQISHLATAHRPSFKVMQEIAQDAMRKSGISLKRKSNGQLVWCHAKSKTPAEQPLHNVRKIHYPAIALLHISN
jgi:hypothetical protein